MKLSLSTEMESITHKREASNTMQSAIGEREKKALLMKTLVVGGLVRDVISTDESNCFFTTEPKSEVLNEAFLEVNSSMAWFFSLREKAS